MYINLLVYQAIMSVPPCQVVSCIYNSICVSMFRNLVHFLLPVSTTYALLLELMCSFLLRPRK